MDDFALDVERLLPNFKDKAQKVRRLADGLLDDDFRRRLIEVADDYEHKASKLIEVTLDDSDTPTR